MFLSCGSPTGPKLLFEKIILYMISSYIYTKYQKKIFNYLQILFMFFSRMITKVYESFLYTLQNIIFNLVFLDYTYTLSYLSKLLCFVSNVIYICCYFEIPKKLSYLWIPEIFLKKIFKATKKQNEIFKQISSTYKYRYISIITIGILFKIFIAKYENLVEPKQHIDVKTKNPLIVPILSFRLNDNETIWNFGLACENESIDQGRSYIDKSINISLCFFSRYSLYDGKGSIIYVNGGSHSMNINHSMFYNCACSNQGGAIYFDSSNSCIRMICANSCSCGDYSHGNFAYLRASLVNQVEYLSVSNCSHTTSGYYSIWIELGNQRVDNTNSSMNNVCVGSGIVISSPSSFTSLFCTFSNNKVSDYICIWFYSSSGIISMSYANIVHNNSPFQYGVVSFDGGGSRKMMYCIFHNNQNILFCVSGGSLEMYHSFIDHSASFSRSTSVSTSNNNSFTIRITYQLQFFNSIHCNADIPLIDSTPVITFEKSPIRSLEYTIRRTNEETSRITYERTIDQTNRETPKETIHRSYAECIFTHQMANWREISLIFSFSFLYPSIILMIL